MTSPAVSPATAETNRKVPPEALRDSKMAGFINDLGTVHESMFVEEQIREAAVESSALASRLFEVTADVAGALRAQANDANMHLKALALRVVADNPMPSPLAFIKPVPCVPLVKFAEASGFDVDELHRWRVERSRGICPVFNRCGRCLFLTWAKQPSLIAAGSMCPDCHNLKCARTYDHEKPCGRGPTYEELAEHERHLLTFDLDFRNERYAEIASFGPQVCAHDVSIDHDPVRGVMTAEFTDGSLVLAARFSVVGTIVWSASTVSNKTVVRAVGGKKPLTWENAMAFFKGHFKGAA